MDQAVPLVRLAELLYRDEAGTVARTERALQFLASAPQPIAKIRSLVAEAASGDRYAAFHAARFVDQVRALAALRCGAPGRDYRVLDIGVAAVTALYAKMIDGITLETAGLPWTVPAEAVAKKFGSSVHYYIDLEEESFLQKLPELRETYDAVVFCEIIEHIRASPQEMVAELLWLLRPGGHLIISTPNALNRGSLTRLIMGRKSDTVYTRAGRKANGGRDLHVREYTPLELREAIAAAGGETVEEGMFDWYGDQPDHPLQQASSRHAMMFVVRRKG